MGLLVYLSFGEVEGSSILSALPPETSGYDSKELAARKGLAMRAT